MQPRATQPVVEYLENRQLLDATILQTLGPKIGHPAAAASDNIDLSTIIDDPAITGTVVSFDTTAGTINVALTDAATPQTVANFLAYVNSGAYNNTFFHRSANFEDQGGGTPENPADIIQGGGFSLNSNNAIVPVTSLGNIPDEYTTEVQGNVTGTIAMGREGDANGVPIPGTANSEFYFNVHDNTGLDTPSVPTGYTTFGTVIGMGMTAVDTIAALPTADLSSVNSALNTLPVTGIPESQIATAQVSPSNLEFINTAKVIPAVAYTVTSDNPALVTPVVTGNTLSFTYGTGLSGVANITITGASGDGDTSQTETFAITVPNPAQPAQGPVANPDSSDDILHDTSGVVHPLANDTDSLAAINPSTVLITTEPAQGTATVDTTTGDIDYTPAAGFVGTDTLQYTVKDIDGNISAPATVTLNVVPDPTQVSIGLPGAKDLTFTQPDGTVAHLVPSGGLFQILFTSSHVTITNSHGHVFASGSGADIVSITITDDINQLASIAITSKNGVPVIGEIDDPYGGMSSINAPTTQLTGNLSVLGLASLNLASTVNSTITIGGDNIFAKSFFIGTATNTSISDVTPIPILKGKSFLNPQGTGTISCPYIGSLQVSGEFDEDLTLSDQNFIGLKSASIGTIGAGTWTISGPIESLNAHTAAASWSLTTQNLVKNLHIGGDLSSNISAGAITNLSVGGNLSNATIHTEANWTAGFFQLKNLTVGGSITDSKIIAEGNINSISAKSISGSSIEAGLNSSALQNGPLPSSHTDFTATGATIRSIQLPKTATFSDSTIIGGILGDLRIGKVTTVNGGTADGIAAGIIGSVSARLDSGSTLALTNAEMRSPAVLQAYLKAKNISKLNDFQIDVLT